MKALLKLFLFLSFIGILLMPAILCIDTHPNISQKTPLSRENVQQVKKIIQENRFDSIKKNAQKTLTLSETDLNLLLEYSVSKTMGLHSLASRVNLSPGLLTGTFTIKIPDSVFGTYINLSVMIKESRGIPELYAVKIGKISIPKSIASLLVKALHRRLLQRGPYGDLYQNHHAIKQVRIDDAALRVWYEWDPAATQNLKTHIQKDLIPSDHQARLVKYHNELARLSHQVHTKTASLVTLLQPMFAFAALQSNASGTYVQENKALFQVLALWSIGQNMSSVIDPELQQKMAVINPIKLLLGNRQDLSKHFLVSAALTVSTSNWLANLMGLAKELDDTNNGSGFSFADLAADKAGVKMGEIAIADQNQARQLQQRMQLVFVEEAFMPDIAHLPEGIMALEFKTRYQDMDATAYKRIDSEIRQRLENCSLYQN